VYYYYHIRITTKSNPSHDEVKFDLNEEKVHEQILIPYRNNNPIVINGKVIYPDDIERIRINRTNAESSFLLRFRHRELARSHKIPEISDEWYVAIQGEEVTDELLKVPRNCNKPKNETNSAKIKSKNNKIFVVHGHDEEMKHAVARTLEKLDLKPIILHEQPNQGKTIIEKFESYSENVSFAIVLLSPDDIGYKKDQSPRSSMFRARQNVILELGYFMGKLGRKNVFVLHRKESNFELPSDILGTLYTPFDPHNGWKLTLSNELKAAGYDIDFGKL